MKLLKSVKLGPYQLKNRIVMAPMTRSRAINNNPNDSMAHHYAMRADAGLLITEGVAPSPNGLGYPRIPGVFSQDQMNGWKKVASAVHEAGGHIFMQLMHTGRVSHPDNMAEGSKILAPSAIGHSGQMYTDTKGMQPFPTPKEMTLEEIISTQEEYVQAARNAIECGSDGIELHGANGYLIDQFLNPASNQRVDSYGGSIENRCRFALEVASKVAEAIGHEKTGIRLSPYGVFNDMIVYENLEETYKYLAIEMSHLNLCFIHTVDHSAMPGTPEVPDSVKNIIKKSFEGPVIACGGMDRTKAEAVLSSGQADLIAFGVPFLANPDLVKRLKLNLPLNQADMGTFFTPGEKGYNDYPLVDD